MIITKDFVFIHMPKTGGTFVHGIYKKIINQYKKKYPIKWYLNRFWYRLKIAKPIYQKLSNVAYDEYPNDYAIGQHAGVSFIPKQYNTLPIISVKRDPIKKFISAYYFRWWERFPRLALNELLALYPHYPELSIEEYFELSYIHIMKSFFKKDYREDIGVLSWQFIRMYSYDPIFVYKNITHTNYSKILEAHFADVKFFEMEQLATQFEKYILQTNLAEFSDYFKTGERIYPPGSSIKKRSENISDTLIYEIKSKEWLLYKIFPEYNQ